MNCIYFDESTSTCMAFASRSVLPYRPTPNEVANTCKSDQFQKCKRFQAFHKHLSILATKEDIWLVDPKIFPRSSLLARAREIVRALSPEENLESEFVHYANKLLFDQIQSFYRENLVTEVSLKRMQIASKGVAVKVNIIWNYMIRNITNSSIDFYVPLRVVAYSFEDLGLPIQEHIGIRQIEASVGDTDEWIDLGAKYKLYSVPAESLGSVRVQLDLSRKAVQTIPAESFIKMRLEFFHVARLIDTYTQRMLALTRNLELKVDYSEEDFFIDVDDFLLPSKETRVKGHNYKWSGWLSPFQGISVEWIPVWMVSSSLKTVMMKEREYE